MCFTEDQLLYRFLVFEEGLSYVKQEEGHGMFRPYIFRDDKREVRVRYPISSIFTHGFSLEVHGGVIDLKSLDEAILTEGDFLVDEDYF